MSAERILRARLSFLTGVASLAAGCHHDASSKGAGGVSGAAGADPETYLTAPSSCAYDCPNAACGGQTTPYACPALGAWASVPHLSTCLPWDGSYPALAQGRCSASAPTGVAPCAHRPGAGDPGGAHAPRRQAHPARGS